ncbi:MAG: LacI family DNA-binding transcriptional regulator [Bacteroidota bacterium]
MASTKRSVTIEDVARKAGVSVSTVSRVLNGKVDVARETQEHVLAVIEEMGYIFNLAARSMRSRRKNLIGLVVPDIRFPYAVEIMKGVNQAIAETSFDLLLYTTGGIQKAGTEFREQHYVSLLSNSLVDGVIVAAASAGEFSTDAPIVAVDPHVLNADYPSVQATNYRGAKDATEYLIRLGHRRIAFINGRPEIQCSARRLKGYQDALVQGGIELDPDLSVDGDFSTETGHERALQLLSMTNPPTAIFASNDQSALGVYRAAEELGVRIPDDLSVVGFDNISEARYMGLTTVDQFLTEMGYVAVQMLIKLINDQPLELQVHKISTRLVERTSCRALAAASASLENA